MKRLLVPTAAAAAAVLVFAVVSASAGHAKAQHHKPGHPNGHGGATIHVIEHASTDAVTNPVGGPDAAGRLADRPYAPAPRSPRDTGSTSPVASWTMTSTCSGIPVIRTGSLSLTRRFGLSMGLGFCL